MGQIVLGLGDYGCSKTPGDIVKTFALGSCIAVVLIDIRLNIVGMVHVVLPESAIDATKAKDRPGYFADTGIPILMKEMTKMGSQGRFIVNLIGGAEIMDPNNSFNIGKRNALAIKKILWANRLAPMKEELGGTISRTVEIEVDTKIVVVSNPTRGRWTL